MEQKGNQAEHELVQSYYRILKDLNDTRKDGDPEVSADVAATLAAAAVLHEQMEYQGEAIKSEISQISELLSKD